MPKKTSTFAVNPSYPKHSSSATAVGWVAYVYNLAYNNNLFVFNGAYKIGVLVFAQTRVKLYSTQAASGRAADKLLTKNVHAILLL